MGSICYMAMSSYPYASNYISGAIMGTTDGSLPAYPVKYACNEYLTQSFDTDAERVEAIGAFNAVFWNSDGADKCLDTDGMWDTYNNYIWDYLYCRSLLMPSGTKGGSNDMLYASEWNVEDTISWCNMQYEIEVDEKGPASRKYGGRNVYKAMSNIVFSNGDMDPWMPGGVVTKQSESVVNIMIEAAGHHLDLMFSNSADPQSVVDARNVEIEHIEKWISEANNKYNAGMCDAMNVDSDEEPVAVVDELFEMKRSSVVKKRPRSKSNHNVFIVMGFMLIIAAVLVYGLKEFVANRQKEMSQSNAGWSEESEPLTATIY